MKIAIVGFGYIAPFHASAFRSLEVELVASSRSEAGRARAKADGIERVYDDHRTLIAKESPDGIVVCVSADAVSQVAKDLLATKLPLLLEKPPAVDAAAADALVKAAGERADTIMVGLNRRFYSVLQEAIARLKDAGGIRAVRIEAPERMARIVQSGEHPEHVLATWAYANSLHCIDLLPMICGDCTIDAVATDPGPGPHELNILAQGRGADGVRFQYASLSSSPGPWRVDLYGDGLRATLCPLEDGVLLHANGKKEGLAVAEHDRELKAGFWGQSAAFLQSIEEGVLPWPAASLRKAAESMHLVKALAGYKR